eukprot:gene27765-40556_t
MPSTSEAGGIASCHGSSIGQRHGPLGKEVAAAGALANAR